MKLFVPFSLLLSLLFSMTGLAQTGGDPTSPPATVAATMKTLDQVEARIPLVEGAPGVVITRGTIPDFPTGTIDTVNIIINRRGSYYLTESVLAQNDAPAIEIGGSDVTLDLNGFTVRGSGNTAILIKANENISIKNGSINVRLQTGFSKGIAMGAFDTTPDDQIQGENIRVSEVSISGVSGVAVDLPGQSHVSDCLVSDSNTGIQAEFVRECNVRTSGKSIEALLVHSCVALSSNDIAIIADNVIHSIGRSRSSAASTAITAPYIVDSTRSFIPAVGDEQSQNIRDVGQEQEF